MSSYRRRDRKARAGSRGFTLVEVTIALTILSIGTLSLGAMQLFTMQYGNRGRHFTEAGNIAQTRIEQLQRLRWTDPVMQPTAGWSAATQVNSFVQDSAGNQIVQTFQLRHRIADSVAGLTRAVDVRVQWDEPDRPGRSFALSTLRFNLENL